MLQPNSWTRVPGTFEVDIYPIIRKPSIVCSSTSILKTPRQMIIIDPGGDVSQIEHIRRIVMQVLREGALSVYIFLTHCHRAVIDDITYYNFELPLLKADNMHV
ncbi:MAG: hypothetical protein NTX75_07825 [Proteobacteria bacterium]|nr:hypothetical protein [Pseudomonadota bacterium]